MKAGWKRKPLGSILSILNGYAFDAKAFSFESGIPLIRIRDLKNGFATQTNFDGPFDQRYVVTAGSFLIGMDGEFGCFEWYGPDALLNQRVCKLHSFAADIDPRFLFYGINKHLKEIEDNTTFTTVKHLSSKQVANIDFVLPPIEEQRRIVALLGKAFASIATTSANAQKNLTNARVLFESYLRSVFDTPNTEWHRTTLGKLTTKIGSGATPRGGKQAYQAAGTPLIRSMNVHDRFFKEHNLAFINDSQAKLLNNVVVQRNDVLLNITGASVARCCIVPDQWTNGRVNQHVAIIRADAATIRPQFIELALTSPYYKDILLGVGEKGGSTRQAITKADIQKLDIAFPNLAKQDSFVDHATSLQIETRKLAEVAKQKIDALTELKQSLLQKAFAGELT